MDQWPIMWTDIILRNTKFYPRYKNMAMKITSEEEAPQRRPGMEPRSMLTSRIHPKNPLVRKLIVPRNCLAVGLVQIFRGEERRENVLRAVTLKSLRKPSHPLLIGRLRRGEKHKIGYLV
jgi:hypothetical protein